MSTQASEWMTPAEVCSLLGVGPRSLSTLIEKHGFPVQTVAGPLAGPGRRTRRFDRVLVEEWLRRRES